jgi:hypothetical protein
VSARVSTVLGIDERQDGSDRGSAQGKDSRRRDGRSVLAWLENTRGIV